MNRRNSIFLFILLAIMLIPCLNVNALTNTGYDDAKYRLSYYKDTDANTLVRGSWTNLDTPTNFGSSNAIFIQNMGFRVYGSSNNVYKAGNTYNFVLTVTFSPKQFFDISNYADFFSVPWFSAVSNSTNTGGTNWTNIESYNIQIKNKNHETRFEIHLSVIFKIDVQSFAFDVSINNPYYFLPGGIDSNGLPIPSKGYAFRITYFNWQNLSANELLGSAAIIENQMGILNGKQDAIIGQNQQIISGQNNINNSIKDTNDYLKDNNTDEATNEASSFFSGFDDNTHGLTSIVTAPLNLIGSITSSTCTPIGLDIPFVPGNKKLELPCMSSIYRQYFGSFLSIYQTITFGLISYWVCVNVLALVKGFKDPDSDNIEVIDL